MTRIVRLVARFGKCRVSLGNYTGMKASLVTAAGVDASKRVVTVWIIV